MEFSSSPSGLKSGRIRDTFDGDDPNWAIAAKQPALEVDALTKPVPPFPKSPDADYTSATFVPREPTSFSEAGLRGPQVEALILKFLLNSGGNTGREIASQITLPFGIVEPLLRSLKIDQLVVYRSGSIAGDYTYELTARGAERGRSYAGQSTYFGSAPVTLKDYAASVEAQSCRHQKPRFGDVQRTFSSLVLSDRVVQQLGEAANLGIGFFLHGAPGNGKTSIAKRVTSIYSDGIWIPRAIQAGGEIIRVYDPNQHDQLPWDEEENLHERRIDGRWVFIKRPTIIVGGELRLDNLEINTNQLTGISEAPLQLKSNCGTFVIDDFGRQSFRTDDLLNRLIIPLERREDVLNVPSGRSFKTPFDLLIVFCTNLVPEGLVDEAFLRRVPFTICAENPSEAEFREVFRRSAEKLGLAYGEEQIDYLLEKHYRQTDRQMRFCHPHDLLVQVQNSCDFLGKPPTVTNENIDGAVRNSLAIRTEWG